MRWSPGKRVCALDAKLAHERVERTVLRCHGVMACVQIAQDDGTRANGPERARIDDAKGLLLVAV